MRRSLMWVTVAVALGVFCIVQDRVTAAGARRYVALQRAALAGRGPAVTIDEIMRPAIAQSVRVGLLSGAGAIGLSAILTVARTKRDWWPDA